MPNRSGGWAMVGGRKQLRQWTVSDTNNLSVSDNSATKGGKRRKSGVYSWQGSWEAEGIMPGNLLGKLVPFSGFAGPSNNVSGGTGLLVSGIIAVNQIVLTIDITSNQILRHTVNFLGHLKKTEAAASAAITDATEDPYFCSGDVVLDYDDGTGNARVEFVDWKTITVTFTSNFQAEVNSGTKVDGDIWTAQTPTGDFDWTLAIAQAADSEPLAKSVQLPDLQLAFGGDNPWLLGFGKVDAYTGLTVSATDKSVKQRTANIMHDSHSDIDDTIGHVQDPEANVLWPPGAAVV